MLGVNNQSTSLRNAFMMPLAETIEEAMNFFLSNSSGSIVCESGEHRQTCASFIEAKEFFERIDTLSV